MNLTAYLIGVITFLALIFTTAGLTIRNRNSSITSNLNQGYKPIMFTDFTIPKNNKRLQKRSVSDDVSVEGKEQDLRKNQSHIALNTKMANTKSKIDISSLLSLSPNESTKFLEYFENDISELIKAEEQEIKTMRQIMHSIKQKIEEDQSKVKSQKEEFENLQNEAKMITNMLEKVVEENWDKMSVIHPEHDKKYENEYFKLLEEEYKILLAFDRLINEIDNCLEEMIKNANRIFEIFFYDYEFDYERFNKKILKRLVDSLYSSIKEEYTDDFDINYIVKERIKKKEDLENNYLKGTITEEFYLKRKEIDEKISKIINKILLNINNMNNNKKPEEHKMIMFFERIKIVLEQDE